MEVLYLATLVITFGLSTTGFLFCHERSDIANIPVSCCITNCSLTQCDLLCPPNFFFLSSNSTFQCSEDGKLEKMLDNTHGSSFLCTNDCPDGHYVSTNSENHVCVQCVDKCKAIRMGLSSNDTYSGSANMDINTSVNIAIALSVVAILLSVVIAICFFKRRCCHQASFCNRHSNESVKMETIDIEKQTTYSKNENVDDCEPQSQTETRYVKDPTLQVPKRKEDEYDYAEHRQFQAKDYASTSYQVEPTYENTTSIENENNENCYENSQGVADNAYYQNVYFEKANMNEENTKNSHDHEESGDKTIPDTHLFHNVNQVNAVMSKNVNVTICKKINAVSNTTVNVGNVENMQVINFPENGSKTATKDDKKSNSL